MKTAEEILKERKTFCRCQSYKTFFLCQRHCFKKARVFATDMFFHFGQIFSCRVGDGLYSWELQPNWQILDHAGKPCQGQTL